MKIQMTLDVTESARKYIATLSGGETIQSGLATREAVVAYLQAVVSHLTEDGSILPTGKLTEDEMTDTKEAVTYLRAQGKTDGQIRAWLMLQRARYHFGAPHRPAHVEA